MHSKTENQLVKNTTEQQLLVDSINPQMDNSIVINALPGTGKTYSIVQAIKKIRTFDKTGWIVTCAYNKAIAVELQKKMVDNRLTVNTISETIHALGFEFLRQKVGSTPIIITEFKSSPFIIEGLKENGVSMEQISFLPIYLMDTVFTLMKENLIENSEKICRKYNILPLLDLELEFDLFTCLDEAFEKMNKESLKAIKGKFYNGLKRKLDEGFHIQIDFTDMVYLSVTKNLIDSNSLVDYILVDEAQDLSPLKLKFIQLLSKNTTKVLYFGDINQCINQYAGATSEIFKTLINQSQNFYLTNSMRCSKSVVNKVNEDFPLIDFKAFEKNIEGKSSITNIFEVINQLKNLKKDETAFIMNSENSPLFITYLILLKEGFNIQIKGNEVEKYLNALLKKSKDIADLKKNINIRLNGAIKTIKYHFPELKVSDIQKQDLYKSHSDPITVLFDLVNHFFKVDLSFDTDSVVNTSNEVGLTLDKIKTKLHEVYRENHKSNITLLTCHKSKGLEADKVFITDFEKLYVTEKENTDLEQFNNVRFVALTRAKNELYFVETFDPMKIFENTELENIAASYGLSVDGLMAEMEVQRLEQLHS